MKTILVGINSKYTHTMLSVRCLASYAHSQGIDCEIREFTINNTPDATLRALYAEKADVYAFSVYIFNISAVMRIAEALKKLLPGSAIVFGGPEVSYETEDFMRAHPYVDFVLCGEGERVFSQFVSCYCGIDGTKKEISQSEIAGIAYFDAGTYHFYGTPEVCCSLDEFPFPYEDDLTLLRDRILYYESSRGCPYRCSYCLSSVDKNIRARSLDRVKEELKKFTDAGVGLVKFVDRTFNYDGKRAFEIMRYLSDNDNGVTSFHFEIAAWCFTDEMISFLDGVSRKSLFQFEVGIQSSNKETLAAINRNVPLEKLFERVKKIVATGFHVHVDLICGLPYENMESFERSFNDVYSLGAQCVQLGFLKILKGAPIAENREYGNVFDPAPPYEILYNNYISFDDVIRLKRVEELVELYFNSGLISFLSSEKIYELCGRAPFEFFSDFADYLLPEGFFDVAHKTSSLFDSLYAFLIYIGINKKYARELCAFDFYRFGKAGAFPEWLEIFPDREEHKRLCGNKSRIMELLNFSSEEADAFMSRWHRESELVRIGSNYVLFLYGKKKRVVFCKTLDKNTL